MRVSGKAAASRPLATLVPVLLLATRACREELGDLAGKVAEEKRIRFTGAVPSAAVHEWVQIADVFTLVSSLEGLPVSLIEAMATGLPVVVSDIPANRQLVDPGIEGLVVETKDANAIGKAIVSILSDGEMRQRMGAAGKARVGSTYSTDRVVGQYETLFARLLSPARIGFRADQG